MAKELPLLPILGMDTNAPQMSLDGEHITVRLIGPGGMKVPLQLTRGALSEVASRMTRAQLLSDSVAATRGAPAEMITVAADRVSAQAPYGAPFVALTVLTHAPLLQHFEVSPEHAERLATELHDAAREARKNAELSRH